MPPFSPCCSVMPTSGSICARRRQRVRCEAPRPSAADDALALFVRAAGRRQPRARGLTVSAGQPARAPGSGGAGPCVDEPGRTQGIDLLAILRALSSCGPACFSGHSSLASSIRMVERLVNATVAASARARARPHPGRQHLWSAIIRHAPFAVSNRCSAVASFAR